MGPFYLPWNYCIGIAIWCGLLVAGGRWLLRGRQKRRREQQPTRRYDVLLAGWMLLLCLTSLELYFAVVVDRSDAFNMTNVSKHWFRRHVDPQMNPDFRDRRPFTHTVPEGIHRLVFLGDSFTFGHGVPRCEDRFTDRVERLLNAGGEERYWCANLASPGWETSMVTGLMQATIQEQYEFDVAIYVYMLNDIEPYDPRTQEVIKSLQGREPRFFLIADTYFPNWVYFRLMQFQGNGGNYFPFLRDSYSGPPWQALKGKLKELVGACRDKQKDFRMVIFPFLHNLGPDYPFHDAHQQLVKFCQEQKVPVLDLEPVLKPHVAEGLTVNPFDSHPNEHCHALAAEAIYNSLLADLHSPKSEVTKEPTPDNAETAEPAE